MCKNNKKQPIRRCIACGDMYPKELMLRVVKLKDDQGNHAFIVDESKKINGRGAYMCHKKVCLEQARKSRGLERSFKMGVPQETYDKMEEEVANIEE